MPAYESDRFEPPAPVIRAHVMGPGGRRADVMLLIDSGADVSVVPRDVSDAVGVRAARSSSLVEFLAGQSVLLDQAELTVEFSGYRFRGVYLITDAPYGLLGRNVLNALKLTLDGPGLTWSIVE